MRKTFSAKLNATAIKLKLKYKEKDYLNLLQSLVFY